MEWVEVLLPSGALAEEIAALIAETTQAGRNGVEVRDTTVVMWVPAGEAEAARQEIRAAAARLRDEGFPTDPDEVTTRPAAPEHEWRDAWKRFFHIHRPGKRIVIVPSWTKEQHQPLPDDVTLDLDPGRAFGTGAHASTRLCLIELERLCDEEKRAVSRFLDVGTGSGILAIAAAKLWPAATGEAIDNDGIAVGAATENLERNGIAAGRVRISEDPIATIEGAFDLILANIQLEILEQMRDELIPRMAPGGVLVLSGLLAPQAQMVADWYEHKGLARLRLETLPDDFEWSSAVLLKPQ